MLKINEHCAELDRCNQRGGRMLSIFDLIEAGTVDLDLAAYLMARLSRGASFMVGARPGGAGKTTVMCALLNLCPADRTLFPATGQAVREALRVDDGSGLCAVCHEIGAGPYFAYLWDEDLRLFCSLRQRGILMATNLHADDLEEARDQVCAGNDVPLEYFNGFDLMIFLSTGGLFRQRRSVGKLHASDGAAEHHLIHDASSGQPFDSSADPSFTDSDYLKRCREFLEKHLNAGVRTIEETRRCVLGFFREGTA